jgi:hypothetical protein
MSSLLVNIPGHFMGSLFTSMIFLVRLGSVHDLIMNTSSSTEFNVEVLMSSDLIMNDI